MKAQQKFVSKGQLNRNRIIMELLKSPLTFTALKKEVKLSAKTLTDHLKSLLNESLIKREIQGKYVVYKVVAQDQTILELRKTFSNQLNWLLFEYWNCLSKETQRLLNEVNRILEKSIAQPEPDAFGKITRKTIKIPEGTKKGTRIVQDSNIYERPKFLKPDKSKKRGRRKTYES